MHIRYTVFLMLSLFVFANAEAKGPSDSVSITVFPNPSNGLFNLVIASPVAQKIAIETFSLLGISIQKDSFLLQKGSNSFQYDLRGKTNGMYILQTSGQGWTKNQKIVIQNELSRSDSLDILHYDLSLSIQNFASKTISGTAIINVLCKVNGLQNFKLDLLKLAVSSVQVNAVSQIFSQTDSTLSIQLTQAQQQNDTFEIAITYNGQPVTDSQWGGFYFSGNYAYNMGVAFQSNPHNFGRCWFPCIDNFTDRATYSFHITTDATFKAVCNGLMLPETPNQDGSTTWNWQLNQPIPTYLANVAVGNYEFVKYEFTGISRTYPLWIAVIAADTAKAKLSFAKLIDALHCFEQKYGAYPFDRIGYVGVPFTSGAMEHATNISYPNYAINGGTDYETLFAHELSHMWWGDLATTRTAEEMWLNEGWASFNEALFLECVYGKQAYLNDIQTKSIDVLLNAPKDDGAWLPVSGVPHNATYGTHVYKKGALMVHTLRTLMGDSSFFAATRNYMATHRFTDVTTAELQNSFQPFTQIDLVNFFQKWLLSPGHSDIVLSDFSNTNGQLHVGFMELSRKNELTTASLPFEFTAYLSNGTQFTQTLFTQSGIAHLDTNLAQGITLINYSINKNTLVQLGHLSQKQSVAKSEIINFVNALISINVQVAGSATDSLTITHHWVGPLAANIRAMGIKPSSERYWTVSGIANTGFKAWGFLNYDGIATNFLDAELITQTEDSLVLLYRSDVNTDWTIHTDNTFQPGASKTDKTGRFWVTNLKNGEYAFGMRNAAVVGLKEEKAKSPTGFLIVPNPSDSENHITLEFGKSAYLKSINILTLDGKQVKALKVENTVQQQSIMIEELPIGAYIVLAEYEGTVVSQKWIKTR